MAVAPAAVVAMISMLAVRDRGRAGVVTTLLLPVAATVSFTLAALTSGSVPAGELVFLAVMFVAVYVRRFGPRALAAGMAAFIGYFLALFLQVRLAAVPAMAGAAAVGAGTALLARHVLLRERPDRAWNSGVRIGVLYGLLGRFSIAFLEVRLVETVVGAAAGAVAALFVLPRPTRGVVAESAEAFFRPLSELLGDAADDLRSGPEVRSLVAAARDVDDRMHALLTSASPLGRYRFGDARARYERWRQLVTTCAAATRQFARTAGPAASTSDEDTRIRLAELACTVAALARAVADREPTADLADQARRQEGTLVDLVEAVHAGPTALRAAIHQLGRLGDVLTDLSREFGPSPHSSSPDRAAGDRTER
jgi:hypothetical protein